MVRANSPLRDVADVDRPGVRVTVAERSAYDLYLGRTLAHAHIVRAATGAEAIDRFLREGCEVAAGIKGSLDRFASTRTGLRVMPGRFMVIEQAMGTRKGREVAWRYLSAFVEEMKANGFVAAALSRSGQSEARVAPAASSRDDP